MAPPKRRTSFSEAIAYVRTNMELQGSARRLSRSLSILQANLMSLNRCTPPKQDCIYRAFDKANPVNVFVTSFPFEGMVTKRIFCTFFFFIFIQFLFLTISPFYSPPKFQNIFRFVVLGIRDPNERNASEFKVSSVGLLYEGLSVTRDVFKSSRFESSITLELNESVEVNEWYFTTSNLSKLLDPVQFLLEGGNSNGTSAFEIVGASSIFITDYGEKRFRPMVPYETTTDRDAREIFDLVLPWQIPAQYRVRAAMSSTCYLWLCSCYFTKYYQSARWAVAISTLLSIIAMVLCAVSVRRERLVASLLMARSLSLAAIGWSAARH